MANEENQDAEKAPMTIKAVPIETRKDMAALAQKQGQTMAEWLTQTVAHMKRLQAGERVLPPATQGKPQPGLPAVRLMATQPFTMAELAEALRAAKEAGVTLQRRVGAEANAFIYEQVRLARGLPVRRPGKTEAQNGQTILDGEAE